MSQADADCCYRCMNFHMGDVGSGRHRKTESTKNFKDAESITNLREWKFGSMRLLTNLKCDTSLNVVVQMSKSVGDSKTECLVCVEDLTLRISAAQLRHEMTNPERHSLRGDMKLRGQFCAS